METTTKLGSVGQRVAKEVARLRGRVPVRELSARLKELGRPILPSGITKIEQGQRRVDVDDLVALAVALEVTPNRLLLGPPPTDGTVHNPVHDEIYERSNDDRYDVYFLRLLPELSMEPWDVWAWAMGESPLGEIWRLGEERTVTFGDDPGGFVAKFQVENAPPPTRMQLGHAEGLQDAMTGIDDAVKDALDEGLTEDQIEQLVRRSITSWKREKRVRTESERRFSRVTERRRERNEAYLDRILGESHGEPEQQGD